MNNFWVYVTTKNSSLDKSYITLSSWRGNRGKEGEFYVAPFLQLNKESCFWRKCPGFIHLWVKFLIENAVLRTSQKKISEIIPCQSLSFACCRLNVYRSTLILRNLSCPQNFLVTRLISQNILVVSFTCTRNTNVPCPLLSNNCKFFIFLVISGL